MSSNKMMIEEWFISILLSFFQYESYKSYMLVNKSIYNTMKKIIIKISKTDLKRQIFEDFEKYLLKKGIILYGGCVRDSILKCCPMDIDCILPVSYIDELLKLTIIELFYNSTTSVNLSIEQDESSRYKLRKILNSIIRRHPDQNVIDVNFIVKKMITTMLNIDVINVKNCKYIHENWDIMFTIKTFNHGYMINMDVKLTCDKQEFDFLCNAMFQRMTDGKIITYVINPRDTIIDVKGCIQNCIDKKAIMLKDKITLYNPQTFYAGFINSQFPHCNKLHIDVDKHFFERIKKMMEKGFIIDNIDPTKTINDIVGREPCSNHCESRRVICNICSGDIYIKKHESRDKNFRNICDTCIENYIVKCKKCKYQYHHKKYVECSKCYLSKFRDCPKCKSMFRRIQFSQCYKCYIDEKIKINENLSFLDNLPINLLDEDISDDSSENKISHEGNFNWGDLEDDNSSDIYYNFQVNNPNNNITNPDELQNNIHNSNGSDYDFDENEIEYPVSPQNLIDQENNSANLFHNFNYDDEYYPDYEINLI